MSGVDELRELTSKVDVENTVEIDKLRHAAATVLQAKSDLDHLMREP